MRQLGAMHLDERGERGGAESRLVEWAVVLAREAESHLVLGEREWLERLDARILNVRAALRVAVERPDLTVAGLETASRLGRYWFLRSLYREGRDWLARLLEGATDPPRIVLARALYNYGFLAGELGDDLDDAVRALDRSVEIYRETDDAHGLAWALNNRARIGFADQSRARADLDESTRLARETGDRGCVFMNLVVDSCWHLTYGNAVETEPIVEEALAMSRIVGAPQALAHCLELRAYVELALGRPRPAVASLQEAITYARQVKNAGCSCHTLETTAWALAQMSNMASARHLRDTARQFRAIVHAPPAPHERFLGTALDRFASQLDAVAVESAVAVDLVDLDSALDRAAQLLSDEHGADATPG